MKLNFILIKLVRRHEPKARTRCVVDVWLDEPCGLLYDGRAAATRAAASVLRASCALGEERGRRMLARGCNEAKHKAMRCPAHEGTTRSAGATIAAGTRAREGLGVCELARAPHRPHARLWAGRKPSPTT